MRLLKGRKLTAEEWEGLQREEAREDAYRAALAMLERKSRTSRELSEALKRKGYAADIIQGCIERLQARRMLDDSAYARRYAEQKAATQRKGRKLIRQELLQRGIAKDEADRALAALDANVEQEAADALARKKWPQTKGEPIERKWKVAAFLLRRGYPNAVVRAAVEKAMAEAGEQADGFGDDAEIPEDHA
jgi:SOS response regulatory protein OraA/RecX